MTKTPAERAVIARQTEAEFAAEVARLRRDRGKPNAEHYQERAQYWASEARTRLLTLMGCTDDE